MVHKINSDGSFYAGSAEITSHLRKITGTLWKFFDIIATHPKLKYLSEFYFDQTIQKDRRVFYRVLGGVRSDAKKSLINTCLTYYFMNLFMKGHDVKYGASSDKDVAKGRYKMSVQILFCKHIFRTFKTEGIAYEKADFKGMEGSSLAFTSDEGKKTIQERPDYGDRKVTAFDVEADEKLGNNAFPKWSLEKFLDVQYLLIFQIRSCWILRGANDVSHHSTFSSLLTILL